MGSEDKKKPLFRGGFSFPISAERGSPELSEPSELVGETQFVPMDVFENDSGLVMEMDLPSVSADDISVYVQDSWLVIEGSKKDAREVREKAEFLCTERAFGPFKRVFKIPMAVDLDSAVAVYQRGALRILLPKLLDRRRRARKIIVRKVEG